ncbi:MAG: hypothetical protein ACE5FU_01975 [Nitrospinota bacterium]
MKLRFFTVPIHETAQEEDAVNQFLGSHRIVSVDKNFVQDGAESAWCFCVSYTDAQEKNLIKKGKVDYREVLDAPDFKIFARAHDWTGWSTPDPPTLLSVLAAAKRKGPPACE